MKGHGCENYHFHPLNAGIKNTWRFTSAVLCNAAITINLHSCFTCIVVSLGSRTNCVSVKCVNKCPTRCNYTQFILCVNCSTCFGLSLYSSSVAQITVSTAVFLNFVRPRPGKFFFSQDEGRSQQIYASVPFQFLLSSYIKLK